MKKKKIQLWDNSKTQTVTKIKNLIWTRLKNWNCDKNKIVTKLKFWQIQNSNCDNALKNWMVTRLRKDNLWQNPNCEEPQKLK